MTANTSEIHVEDDSKLKHRDGRGRTSVTTRTERGHVGRGWELDTAVLVPHGALVGAHLGLRNVLVDAHRLVETLLLFPNKSPLLALGHDTLQCSLDVFDGRALVTLRCRC